MRVRVRWLSFVVLTTSIVSIYCWLGSRLLPPLRNEPESLLVIPMTVISGAMASLFYPVLHQRNRLGRILGMYFGFVLSLVVYGIYLWWFIPHGSAGLIVLALLAGHMYGLPALLAVLLASLLMERG
jgi:hypothetical protein